MMRTIEDVVELRRWAEAHGARPCRDRASGRLVLALPGECEPPERDAPGVDWGEWESTFLIWRCAFVYDDAPGSSRCFVGPAQEAHAFLERELAKGCLHYC
ncbi:hypothetical protein [Anaeromyxobacter oryzisoli]|jgi:hypothetical protein|uniref:hypothetical protein n=1 Tax=Anaeromyxobacter oryzisoli TaxID=2925408 RepID=UPI001F59272C|nr:hypothetical protein [Anaeromyxobacter sp. SG63]